MYCIVDEIFQSLAPLVHRPGPAWAVSDSELLTSAIVAECRGWDQETEALAHWRAHRDLFPRLPSQRRFNRRRRQLMGLLNLIRRSVLQVLDVAQDHQCVIDSLPVLVVQFHLAPSVRGDWKEHGASYGWVASKKQTTFGYKLHIVQTLGGVILDFELAPAHVGDLEVGAELLAEHTDLLVLGDKGYVSAAVAAELRAKNNKVLLAERRENQREQLPAALRAAMTAARQIVETVNGQLTEQFHIERNHAHSFSGLCARLYTKLTAHTLTPD